MFDITLFILEALLEKQPDHPFSKSLHQQYCNRGGLSKKQLQGLYAAARKSGVVSETHLATLEALIQRKPTRYRSEKVTKAPEFNRNQEVAPLLKNLLEKYPQHKMALFLQNKLHLRQPLTDADIQEVRRLTRILLKS